MRNVLDSKSFSEEDVSLQREILGLKDDGRGGSDEPKETVYTRADPELIEARRKIFVFSVERYLFMLYFILSCKKRLAKQREEEADLQKLAENEITVKGLWDKYSV